MTSERPWVESNLAAYCEPGEHQFLMAEGPLGAIRWCAVCLKEERTDGSGCIICDLRGQRLVTLTNGRRRVGGAICAACYAGFAEEGRIAGWSIAEAEEPAPQGSRTDGRSSRS
ncbi:MAG: hypothetical protein ACM3S1_05235 [Hyphomicrobiales bacterium]